MKAWLRTVDLYKGIILAALVLMPAAAALGYYLNNRIAEGKQALSSATRTKGELEEIGKYMKMIETQAKGGKLEVSDDSIRRYFQTQVFDSAEKGSGLKHTNFEIKPRGDRQLRTPPAVDSEVEITFKDGSKEFPLTRDFLNAVLFNCEMKSLNWKLRELQVRNTDLKKLAARAQDTPPQEIADLWEVERMVFARRLPPDKARK